MISILRKIRRQLLSKNRFSKYFLYALGEIILVVIGILIALQINNWNEQKKQRVFEVKMLTEIQRALISDINYFNILEKRLQKLDSASNKFIQLVHNKAIFKDTLYKNGGSRWYYLRTGINLQYNIGPYEALKSSGIDKVSNDSLRNSLVDFYDFKFPTHVAFVKYYDKGFDDDVTLLYSFLGKPFTEEENGEVKIYSKFPQDLFLKTEFLQFLIRAKRRATNSKRAIGRILQRMKKMENQINKELTND